MCVRLGKGVGGAVDRRKVALKYIWIKKMYFERKSLLSRRENIELIGRKQATAK